MSPSPIPPPRRTRLDEITYALWAFVVAGIAALSLTDGCASPPAKEKGPAADAARPLLPQR
jgi:hypothetical protein